MDWPENSYLINHECKFIYCPIPRVISSNFKKTMVGDLGHEHPGFRCNVHGNIYKCADIECGLRDLKYLDEYFTFVFVRNPWARLVSAYLSKIVKHYESVRDSYIKQVQRYYGLKIDLNKRITFRQFVEYNYDDEHWRPQYLFLGDNKFDFIGRFENLNVGLEFLREKGVNLLLGLRNTVGYNYFVNCYSDYYCDELNLFHMGYPAYKQFYDADLKNLVAERYKEDIKLFGYKF